MAAVLSKVTTPKASKSSKAETDIAVLQVQVNNLDSRLDEIKDEIKSNIKELHFYIDKTSADTRTLIKEIQESNSEQHSELSKKISALEKWRYMLMGAGVAIGALGFQFVAKLLSIE